LPAGVGLLRLSESDAAPELGALAALDGQGFSALNAAFLEDGVLLRLAEGVRLERPLHLLHLSSGVEGGLSCPRLCVDAGDGGKATIIESFAGLGGGRRLVSAVAEIRCGKEARVDHIKLQREHGRALHVGRSAVHQEAGSRYRAWEITFDGEAVRKETEVRLAGSGATCELNSLYLGQGSRHVDNRVRVTHAAAGCDTREIYKGVLDGKSQGVFDGLIYVERDAQQTDAQQTNRNLLLSDDAVAYSMPRLEIYADDVKCTHGSTTGQLDEEQLFYLRTRGIGPEDARSLLTYAFAGEVVDSIEIEPVRRALAGQLLEFLPRSRRKAEGA
jgi:Fe-S cluster assembly protein SufD